MVVIKGQIQDHDKPLHFCNPCQAESKAETCSFTTISECECGKKYIISYTEEAIKDVILAGVGDEDIRREVLTTEDILSRQSFEIIFFIKSKEMGRHATENSLNISAVSSFQQQKKQSFNVGDKSQYVLSSAVEKCFIHSQKKMLRV